MITASLIRTASSFATTRSSFITSTLNNQITTRLFSATEVDPGIVEGTDLRIVKYPHPSLRAHKEEIDSGSISKLAKEMFLVMYAAEGIGLAAPQVGVNKRVMVYNESGDKKKWLMETVLINPKIVEYSQAA